MFATGSLIAVYVDRVLRPLDFAFIRLLFALQNCQCWRCLNWSFEYWCQRVKWLEESERTSIRWCQKDTHAFFVRVQCKWYILCTAIQRVTNKLSEYKSSSTSVVLDKNMKKRHLQIHMGVQSSGRYYFKLRISVKLFFGSNCWCDYSLKHYRLFFEDTDVLLGALTQPIYVSITRRTKRFWPDHCIFRSHNFHDNNNENTSEYLKLCTDSSDGFQVIWFIWLLIIWPVFQALVGCSILFFTVKCFELLTNRF